jgi:hypothetical protein
MSSRLCITLATVIFTVFFSTNARTVGGEEFREIIILREYEELSYQEIAVMLDCPAGTVMSRLARARSKLRVLLSMNEQSFQRNER